MKCMDWAAPQIYISSSPLIFPDVRNSILCNTVGVSIYLSVFMMNILGDPLQDFSQDVSHDVSQDV